MSWSRHGPPPGRRGYHHGNLREALIRATLDLIAERGLSGFSFAEAARAAGVSSAAPYRHYRDRHALIADVAREGYGLFGAELERAWEQSRAESDQWRGRATAAESELPQLRQQLQTFQDQAERLTAVEAVCANLPLKSRPPVLMMSLHVWALSHGIASLFGRGDAGRRKLPMSPEELLEAAVLIYLGGLGLGHEASSSDRP